MNTTILHPDVQQYIQQKSDENIDVTKLILAGSPFETIKAQELAQQIIGKIKARHKLPTWYSTKNIYYPPKLHLEQTSSEETAKYKSTLVNGELLIDITGGFGIDDFYFSKTVNKVVHCELNSALSAFAAHNFTALHAPNIQTKIGNGLNILKKYKKVDWIYIDPSRRNESKGKVFFLEDCLPNVPDHLDFLFEKSDQILVKTAPLLDISAGIKSLQHVADIHIVAVKNEVKELLWVLRKNTVKTPTIHTTNIQKQTADSFIFDLDQESLCTPLFSLPKKYLYEPNAAIMKSGGFGCLGDQLQLDKLHMHSHLYTSDTQLEFPGRIFSIEKVLPYSKKEFSKTKTNKANITTRNFPNSVSEIRKKLKIADGGDLYLFFTTNCNGEKIIIFCRKISL